MKVLSTLVLLSFTLSVLCTDPGITLAVRPQTIIDMKNALLPALVADLQNIAIPNFNTGNFQISNIQINSLSLPASGVNIGFSNGAISVSTSSLAVQCSLHITYDLPFGIHISADTTASASNSGLTTTLDIGYAEATGTMTLAVNDVSVSIQNLNIEISGVLGQIASLIINLVAPLLESSIDSSLQSAFQSGVQTALDNFLSNLDYHIDLPNVPLGANYQIMSCPIINEDYISIEVNGTLYNDLQAYANPAIPAPVPLPTIDSSSNNNIQFFISDYVFNSAFYGLYAADFLKITITNSLLPPSSPIQLDTTSLSILFPGMDTIYGQDKPVQLVCASDSNAPSVNVNSTGIYGEVSGDCIVQVNATGSWVNALSGSASVLFSGDVEIQNYTLFANITNIVVPSISITNSTIPNINVAQLTSLFNTILELSIPTMNQEWLDSGIPIPAIPDTNLNSISVTLFTGYFEMGATPTFNGKELASKFLHNKNERKAKVGVVPVDV
jgi:hypothetical protein